jgi:predicted Zn-dependent peptidase
MLEQTIESFQLDNGLRVVIEPMRAVQSAAMTLLVPAGSVRDTIGRQGAAAVLTQMIQRGAGPYSAREHSARMDNLGLQRNVSVSTGHIAVAAATTSDRFCESLSEIGIMLTSPHLADGEFEAATEIVRQGLMSIADEPQHLLGKALRQYSWPRPWNQYSDGELADLDQLSIGDVRTHHDSFVRPDQAILGIAGNVDIEQVRDAAAAVFGNWTAKAAEPVQSGPQSVAAHHLPHDSSQTHIGLAWETVPYRDERYFEAWAVVGLLSGGMSARLFTEVRERRGLCYSINASISTLVDEGRVFAYAGTTPERAQETLDVTVEQIRTVHEGITEGELQRCKARAKSALIMQQESTMARAGAVARDIYHMGRVVTLAEIHQRVDALTVPVVTEFARQHSPEEMVLVTLGPNTLSDACLPQSPTVAV